MKRIIFILLVFYNIPFSNAQYEDFGFKRDTSVKVSNNGLEALKNPWGGGLNSCQFSQIDLNFDGVKDLFVYDKSSFKILTFINGGTVNSVDYTFAPEYSEFFPKMHDWVLLIDYNCDGKEDIFTYGVGGITVYKNISNPVDGLKFSLITAMINSQQGPNLTNILVTQVDYPGVSDVDNDGDLDIVTFFGLGTYVEYHQNMSMELYGVCDSLSFVKQEYCWGNFAENTNNNSIDLNIVCPWSKSESILNPEDKNDAKHTGSTLLLEDLDGDLDKDLLVGDVDYSNITMLINGGTPTDANMVLKDSLFPSNTLPVSVVSFPALALIDIDNNGTKDLLASPFESNINVADNLNTCWFYKNTGTASVANFEFQKKNIFQEDMIETGAGAYPALADYNGDGLLDLFIGNFGLYDSSYYLNGFLYSVFKSGITLYKNTGTAALPQFEFVTNDFAGIQSLNLIGVVPTFGDLDGDGDKDMIIGDSKGNLYRFENTAGVSNPMNMSYLGTMGIDVGDFSAPQLFDLNGDSLLDIIAGEKRGNLNYYRNTGSAINPVFTLETDSLGHIYIIDPSWSNNGYSVPCFFKDSTGTTRLIVGSESGFLFYYKDIESNIAGAFTLDNSKLGFIYNGIKSAVAVGFLDNDNYPDLIMGNISGGLCYYKGVFPLHSGVGEYVLDQKNEFDIFPNPANESVYIKPGGFFKGKKIKIEIFSSVGKLILSSEINAEVVNNIRVDHLHEGIYFCRLLTDSTYSVAKKLLIIR